MMQRACEVGFCHPSLCRPLRRWWEDSRWWGDWQKHLSETADKRAAVKSAGIQIDDRTQSACLKQICSAIIFLAHFGNCCIQSAHFNQNDHWSETRTECLLQLFLLSPEVGSRDIEKCVIKATRLFAESTHSSISLLKRFASCCSHTNAGTNLHQQSCLCCLCVLLKDTSEGHALYVPGVEMENRFSEML